MAGALRPVALDARLASPNALLAVRAAVNWSWRNNQKLLASGEPEEEDELDVLALEEFLEWQREELRPKTWEDLARGLHQLHGYQEELVP